VFIQLAALAVGIAEHEQGTSSAKLSPPCFVSRNGFLNATQT